MDIGELGVDDPALTGGDDRLGVHPDPLALGLAVEHDVEVAVDEAVAGRVDGQADAAAGVGEDERALPARGLLPLDECVVLPAPHECGRPVPALDEAPFDCGAIAAGVGTRDRREPLIGSGEVVGHHRGVVWIAPARHCRVILGSCQDPPGAGEQRGASTCGGGGRHELHRAAAADDLGGDLELGDRHGPEDVDTDVGEPLALLGIDGEHLPGEQRGRRAGVLEVGAPRPRGHRRRLEPGVVELAVEGLHRQCSSRRRGGSVPTLLHP